MDQNQPNFGGQSYVGPGGAQGDFGSFGMSGGVGAPGMNSSGDVVFTSAGIPEKKGKKKFIIIGVVVGVLAVLLVVLALVFSGGGSGGLFGGGAPAGFNELREFIENGDAETRALFEGDEDEDEDEEDVEEEDSEDNTSEDYIMAIRISEQGEAEVRKYYAKLAKLEQNFYDKSVTKVDSDLLAEYGNALKVLRNAINYYETKEGLIFAYENGGNSEADSYYIDNIACNEKAGDLLDICKLEQRYYVSVLAEHKIYADVGCYTEEGYDSDCVEEHYGLSLFIDKNDDAGNSEKMRRDLTSMLQEKVSVFDVLNKRMDEGIK